MTAKAKTKAKTTAQARDRGGAPGARQAGPIREGSDADAHERCAADPVLGPVVALAGYLTQEGLDVDEVATATGSIFFGAGADTDVAAETAARAADLFRALKHVGLDATDAARTAGDVLSRRIA